MYLDWLLKCCHILKNIKEWPKKDLFFSLFFNCCSISVVPITLPCRTYPHLPLSLNYSSNAKKKKALRDFTHPFIHQISIELLVYSKYWGCSSVNKNTNCPLCSWNCQREIGGDTCLKKQGRLLKPIAIRERDSTRLCWEKKQKGRLIIRPSVFANWCLSKLGSYPPTETNIGVLFFSWLHFKGMAPKSFRKYFLGCKIDEGLGEDLYLKGADKEFVIESFIKHML